MFKISIVIPSFNQGKFIEETINSVLNQAGDFELECVVIDGGSNDNTLEILKKYEGKRGLRWISEKDSGQSEAINKGFKIATGDVINWLCSDDLLEPGALQKVADFFNKNREAIPDGRQAKVVFGQNLFIDENGKFLRHLKSKKFSRDELVKRWNKVYVDFNIPQPSVFVKREILNEIGYVNEKLLFAMDYEWYLRINKKYEFYFLDEVLSESRYHKEAKSVVAEKKQYEESIGVSKKYWKENYFLYFFCYYFDLCLKKIYALSTLLKKKFPAYKKFVALIKSQSDV